MAGSAKIPVQTLDIYSKAMGIDPSVLLDVSKLKKYIDGLNMVSAARFGGAAESDIRMAKNARIALKELHGIDYNTPGFTDPTKGKY